MSCLSEDQLYDLLQSPEEHGSAQAHIAGCPACRERLESCRADADFEGEFRRWLPPRRVSIGTADVTAPHTFSAGVNVCQNRSEPEQIPGYDIVREISDGGQGVVYEAVQHAAKRTVALKVLKGGALAGERARWRFEQEIRLIASLRHPNIVVVHDSGIAHGRYFYAMDYVRGQPLDTHIRLVGLDIKGIVRLFQQVCVAVGYAHRRGVIHRDLKPSNVLVSENGVPCVLDFGLAKIMGEREEGEPAVTVAGSVLGTLAYLSPEQTLGKPDLDTRSDVYTLGVILYRLLTCKAPYDTDKDIASACKAIREVDPVRPSKLQRELSDDLDAVVLKAMEKDPQRRYDSASDLAEDLAAFLDGRPVQARSASSLYVLRKLARKHLPETLGLFAVVLAIGSAFTITGQQYLKFRADAQEALAHQRDSERALAEKQLGLGQFHQDAGAYLRQASFGWFLLEWEGDRFERARELLGKMSDPADRRIMSFLLDENDSPEKLLADVPDDTKVLAHFAVGERHRKMGRTKEAIKEFESVLHLANPRSDGWIVKTIEPRLNDLRQKHGRRSRETSGEHR